MLVIPLAVAFAVSRITKRRSFEGQAPILN